MNNEFLPYFITEEIYPIKESDKSNSPAKEVLHQESNNSSTSEESPINYELIVITGNINDQDKELLMNVLKAVKVNLARTLIKSETPNDLDTYTKLLVFEDNPNVEYYQVVKSDKGEKLHSKPLSVFHADRNEKIALWNALKNWFNIQ
jgi:DNA polymerase III psi subunit